MATRKSTPADDPLATYRAKRDFGRTPEPEPAATTAETGHDLAFVIQKHAATRLHYDLRLELDGVMLSWALPKGPSFDPKDKRIAVRTEDHPISYNDFEGTIPPKQYGAGTVIVWDRGTWHPVGDPRQGLEVGKLLFTLKAHKLAGLWELVRIAKPGDRQTAWILFKKHDAHERPRAEYDVVTALPDSVLRRAPAVAATAAPLPAKLPPQLATASTGLPPGGDWHFEIKFDGYRLMTRIEDGQAKLITRGGHDWSSKMQPLVRELETLKVDTAWLDGEICVLGPSGTPDFNALQNAFDRRRSEGIVYFLFDLPYLDGEDLRALPLRDRRARLQALLERHELSRLRFSAEFRADPATILKSAQEMGLEGVIAKRGDAPYVSSRTETWLKLKCRARQEFVIAGFTDRGDVPEAAEIGSLVLGVYDGSRLLPAGNVGSGWDAATAAGLKTRLLKLEVDTVPFEGGVPKPGRWTKRSAGTERWVKPQLVAEVSFADWTPDGNIRHATFNGLRVDKPAREVVREGTGTPVATTRGKTSTSPAMKVSNPDRVIDASTGLTKLDLVRYYESVAPWLLPHLKGRPSSLVRGPSGVGGELFFQKHVDTLHIAEVRSLDPALWPNHDPLLEVPSERAIAACAQMNVIEFHTWNSTVKHIDKPDRVVFDLDPGTGITWKQVQEAALIVHSFLTDLGLESWLKTSGGKGLHVVVPLSPRHAQETVKAFSQAVVQQLARVIPDRFVAKSGASNRVGRIFVDYLRNSHGATTASAFSARSRPGLGVSMPIRWDMLDGIKSGAHWTIATAREHLSFERDDPWAGYWTQRQTLTKAIKTLGVDLSGV